MKFESLSKKIIKKRLSLEKSIEDIQKEIKALQEKCIHHNLRYRNNGSTGHYDRDDSYWTDWFCPDCGKRWTDEYNYTTIQEHLKKYPNAKEVRKYPSTPSSDDWNKFYEI